ncbi:MAG: ATP-binding protein [Caldilineaceae bacterium]|nr:ATP-binding protein [Caldilineaceae bacterium]
MTVPTYTLRIAAEIEQLEAVRRFVADCALSAYANDEAVQRLLIAVTEVATNAIVHGYGGDPGELEIEVRCDEEELTVWLRDERHFLTPPKCPRPTPACRSTCADPAAMASNSPGIM